MHLTIDIGNTATKIAVFESQKEQQQRLLHSQNSSLKERSLQTETPKEPSEGDISISQEAEAIQVLQPIAFLRIDGHNLAGLKDFVTEWDFDKCMVSSTANVTEEMKQQIADTGIEHIYYFDSETPIPIRNLYSTPKTLGPDRLAAAIGAYFEGFNQWGKHTPILIIDSGSAITYDFVNEAGEYLGGNISPGVEMRFRALHEFTAKLPHVQAYAEGDFTIIGNSTETAIRHGVMDGVKHEIQGFICQFLSKYPNLCVFLTGGDSFDFEEQVKNRIFADKFLVSKGLNIILQHIHQKSLKFSV